MFSVIGVLVILFLVLPGGVIGLWLLAAAGVSQAAPVVDHRASVECIGVGTGYNCTVAHVAGTAELGVCWDIVVKCANGVSPTAHDCHRVAPLAKATKVVPLSKFARAEGCDQATSVAVENIDLTPF
jgi:hypothetical protein